MGMLSLNAHQPGMIQGNNSARFKPVVLYPAMEAIIADLAPDNYATIIRGVNNIITLSLACFVFVFAPNACGQS